MSKTFIAIFFYLTIVFNCQHTAAKTEKPLLKISPSIINIGSNIINQKITVETNIINQGSEPVNIRKIKSSCGCFVVNPTSLIIGAGKSIKLEMKIDGPSREGLFGATAWILTDDSSNPVYTIKISGEFIALDHQLLAFPHTFIGGSIVPGSKVARTIQITRNGARPVGPVKISASKKWINVKKEKDGEEKLSLYITVEAPKNLEKVDEYIVVQGSDPNDFIRIPVSEIVLPPIEVLPETVLVTPDTDRYMISIHCHDDSQPKLVSHDFTGDGLNLTSLNDQTADKAHLIVNIERMHSHNGFASGKLLLEFDNAEKKLEIIFVSAPNRQLIK